LWRGFHHDVILVQRLVDRGDLPLTERVVQRRVDQAHRQLQPVDGIAIDLKVGPQPLVLGVGVYVRKFRKLRECGADLGLPFAQFSDAGILQRVLIQRIALPRSHPQVLYRLQEQVRARNVRELAAQPRDHLVAGGMGLRDRFEHREHEASVGLPATGKSVGCLNCRICRDDFKKLRELLRHQLKRGALVGLDAPHDQPGFLRREKSLGIRTKRNTLATMVTARTIRVITGCRSATTSERS